MTSTFHDAPAYQFMKKIPRHPGDGDFKCLLDNTGGRLCVGEFNDEVRYYPEGDKIRDKDGKPYEFVHVEIKLDNLIIDDKAYDYVKRVYVNYDPTNPLRSGSNLPYAHGVDILRFLAAYDGKIALNEILVNPNSPLNKEGDLNYPLVLLKKRKDTDLEELLSNDNYGVIPKGESFKGKRMLDKIKDLEKSIPDNEKYVAQPFSFATVGGIFYKNSDIEDNAIKEGHMYPFKINPPMEFSGEPSLEDFKPRSESLYALLENAKFHNIPDNKISFRTAILGRLEYVTNKKPKWDLLKGGYTSGDYEWGGTVKVINDDYFKTAVTVSNNPGKFDSEEVEVLKHIDTSDDKRNLVRNVDKLIEDLEERDYEFPGSFLSEAAKLERELSGGNEELEELLEKYKLLKEKIDNFKEDEDDADWNEYQKELGELKILADIAMRTKKKSDHKAYLEKMNKISEDFSETSYIKTLNRNISNVTFEDSNKLHWKEITGDELKDKGDALALKRTPILLNKPSENELNTPKEDPDLILDVEDGILYYGTRSEIINEKEKETPIPSKVWVFVEAPSKITYTESYDYDITPGGRNPRNTSNGEPTFDPETEGLSLWLEYKDIKDPRERKLWYKGLPSPKQRQYLDSKLIDLHVQKYNRLDSDLEKIDYLSKLKAESALTYKWVINALEVDIKAFNSVITQYRKPRNLDVDTQLKTMIAQLFGREIPHLNVDVSKKEFDNSEENIQALKDLKEALKNEDDISNVFLDNKKSEKDYKFIFPDGRVISLNAISGVQALIRRYNIKYLEKVDSPKKLTKAIADYNTRISTVTVVVVDVNGKDHLGVTLTIGGGSIKLTLPDTPEVKDLIKEARKLAEENSKDTFVAPRGEEKRAPRTLKEHMDEHEEDMDPTESYYQERASGGYIIFIKKPEMKDKILPLKNLSDNTKDLLLTEYGIKFKEGIYNES